MIGQGSGCSSHALYMFSRRELYSAHNHNIKNAKVNVDSGTKFFTCSWCYSPALAPVPGRIRGARLIDVNASGDHYQMHSLSGSGGLVWEILEKCWQISPFCTSQNPFFNLASEYSFICLFWSFSSKELRGK